MLQEVKFLVGDPRLHVQFNILLFFFFKSYTVYLHLELFQLCPVLKYLKDR